jgi:UDP-N-acetylmuramate dehydrogenase
MKNADSVFSIQENVPLAPYTTLGVGGPARFMVRAGSEEQITGAMDFARAHGTPVFILGGGSNIVVSDRGFPGLVLKIEITGIQTLREDDATISVAAGVEWDSFVQHCADRNLAGVECLSGIPGTVGGSPIQNIGAYGEDVSEVFLRVRALDRNTNSVTVLNNAECRFAYRSSIFNTTHKNQYILLTVDFGLRKNGKPRIDYPDLQERFAGRAPAPTIGEVREAVLQIREAKAMVLRDSDPDSRSAGSFFRNPILTADFAAQVETKARMRRLLGAAESLPQFPAPAGKVKLSAAWFVEHAGFIKGYARGKAGISRKHALALVNRGGATAQEIVDLTHMIQDQVQMQFGVTLEAEPEFVGFEGIWCQSP